MSMEPVDLTEPQRMAAFAIRLIEHYEPKCPAPCRAGVLRNRCAMELDHNSCPRHALATQIRLVTTRLENESGLSRIVLWKSRAPLWQQLGRPTPSEFSTLQWLGEQPGGVFKSPRITDSFDSFVLRHCGFWSSQGKTSQFTLTAPGREYLEWAKTTASHVMHDWGG